jgi:hypothetical protein
LFCRRADKERRASAASCETAILASTVVRGEEVEAEEEEGVEEEDEEEEEEAVSTFSSFFSLIAFFSSLPSLTSFPSLSSFFSSFSSIVFSSFFSSFFASFLSFCGVVSLRVGADLVRCVKICLKAATTVLATGEPEAKARRVGSKATSSAAMITSPVCLPGFDEDEEEDFLLVNLD